MLECLRLADVGLVLLSTTSFARQWPERELSELLKKQNRLLPVIYKQNFEELRTAMKGHGYKQVRERRGVFTKYEAGSSCFVSCFSIGR